MTDTMSAAVIGAGAVGTALARRLAVCGYPVQAVVSRTLAEAEALAEEVGARQASDRLADVPEEAALVFCCVPDDAVAEVAAELARLDGSWQNRFVAHTSGALTAEALAPLAARGAATLSFHPMQTFTRGAGAAAFDGIYVGIEGASESVARGQDVARGLELRSVVLAPEAKARYHLAASIASNFFVTLLALSHDVLDSAGIDRTEAHALLRPLVDATWDNLRTSSPEEVLTGPVVRGDQQTVARHLQAVRNHTPHLMPVYGALAAETARLAHRSGRLQDEQAEALLHLLSEAVDP